MAHFLPVNFLDLRGFSSALVLKYASRWERNAIALRCDGEDLPILSEWKSARAAIQKAASSAAMMFNGDIPIVGDAGIQRWLPDEVLPWRKGGGDYDLRHVRTFTCLWPSPTARIYSGTEGIIPQVGAMTVFDHLALHSIVNLGPSALVMFMVDFERPRHADDGVGAA